MQTLNVLGIFALQQAVADEEKRKKEEAAKSEMKPPLSDREETDDEDTDDELKRSVVNSFSVYFVAAIGHDDTDFRAAFNSVKLCLAYFIAVECMTEKSAKFGRLDVIVIARDFSSHCIPYDVPHLTLRMRISNNRSDS